MDATVCRRPRRVDAALLAIVAIAGACAWTDLHLESVLRWMGAIGPDDGLSGRMGWNIVFPAMAAAAFAAALFAVDHGADRRGMILRGAIIAALAVAASALWKITVPVAIAMGAAIAAAVFRRRCCPPPPDHPVPWWGMAAGIVLPLLVVTGVAACRMLGHTCMCGHNAHAADGGDHGGIGITGLAMDLATLLAIAAFGFLGDIPGRMVFVGAGAMLGCAVSIGTLGGWWAIGLACLAVAFVRPWAVRLSA